MFSPSSEREIDRRVFPKPEGTLFWLRRIAHLVPPVAETSFVCLVFQTEAANSHFLAWIFLSTGVIENNFPNSVIHCRHCNEYCTWLCHRFRTSSVAAIHPIHLLGIWTFCIILPEDIKHKNISMYTATADFSVEVLFDLHHFYCLIRVNFLYLRAVSVIDLAWQLSTLEDNFRASWKKSSTLIQIL